MRGAVPDRKESNLVERSPSWPKGLQEQDMAWLDKQWQIAGGLPQKTTQDHLIDWLTTDVVY